MTTFRYKTNKYTKDINNITTLDIEHKKRENLFINKKKTIDNKNIKLDKLKKDLYNLEKKNDYTDEGIRRKAEIKDSIRNLEKEIYNVDNNIDEIDYYYKTYNILLDYYNEDKNEEENKLESNNILDFFSTKKTYNQDTTKSSLLNEYKVLVDDTYMNKKNMGNIIKICSSCNVEKKINSNEGIYECYNCGNAEILIMDSEKGSYNTIMPDISTYAYKRINHQLFRWLTASLLVLCSIRTEVKDAMLHLIN